MHFFGGAVVALGIFTLNDVGLFIPERWLRLMPVVLLVLLIAMMWEVFELFIGVPIEDNYVADTIADLLLGMLGGAVGYSVGTSVKKL